MSKIIFSKKFKLNLKQELFESLTENRFDLKKKELCIPAQITWVCQDSTYNAILKGKDLVT